MRAPSPRKDRSRRFYLAHRSRLLEKQKRYNFLHRKEILEKKRIRRSANIENNRAINRKSYLVHRQKRLSEMRLWSLRNPRKRVSTPETRARNIANRQRRIETDQNFRLRHRLSNRISSAIKHNQGKKSTSLSKLLGCDILFLKGFLEARFLPDMTWGNYGVKGWHIDHHIPCAEFDLRDPAQQRQCFHYSNLRPLWAAQNIRKSDKLPGPHQAELV